MSNLWDEEFDPFDPAVPQGEDPEPDDVQLVCVYDEASTVGGYPLPANISLELFKLCDGNFRRIVQLLTAALPYLPTTVEEIGRCTWEEHSIAILIQPAWEDTPEIVLQLADGSH